MVSYESQFNGDISKWDVVLILVVVDNGFVLELFMAVKAGKKQS